MTTESGNHLLTESGIQLYTEQGNQLHTEQSNQLYTESGIQFATVSSEPKPRGLRVSEIFHDDSHLPCSKVLLVLSWHANLLEGSHKIGTVLYPAAQVANRLVGSLVGEIQICFCVLIKITPVRWILSDASCLVHFL